MGLWLLRILLLLALPIGVLLGGLKVMEAFGGVDRVRPRLNTGPYRLVDVQTRYGTLKATPGGLAAERWRLKLDLLFPWCYGAALSLSLLLGWADAGRPFPPAWVVLPIAVAAVSDWTENLTQLTLLQRYEAGSALSSGWVIVACGATLAKLASLVFSGLVLVAVLALAAVRQYYLMVAGKA